MSLSVHGFMGRKGHLIFVLKWNRVFDFFRFSFSLLNWKTNFKSQLRFSINIEKWTSVPFFTKSFFSAKTLLWSDTSPKLPLKNESFHLLSIFQKMEHFFSWWKRCIPGIEWEFQVWTTFFNPNSAKRQVSRNAKFMDINIHVNFHVVIHFR